MSILLVEDGAVLTHSVSDAFSAAGFEVEAATSAEAALEKLDAQHFDLMLVDIGLPGIDGFELLRRVRSTRHDVPIMIVSGHDDPHDRLRGFDLGADDYVVKPFLVDELRARARAVMRRTQTGGASEPYRHGELEIDPQRRRVVAAGQEVELTRREWMVLELFLQNRGRVLDKRRIAQACSNAGDLITPNAVEVYVSRLRTKIQAAGDPVRTVRGYGYLWDDQPGQ